MPPENENLLRQVEELQAQVERYRAAANEGQRAAMELDRFFDLTDELFCIATLDGEFKRISQSFQHLLGYSKQELLSVPFVEFVHPDDRDHTAQELGRLAHGESIVGFVNRYRCKDGRLVWLEWGSVPNVAEGECYAVARDITKRQRQDILMEQTQSLARIGGWELDFETNNMHWTPQMYRIHGVDAFSFELTPDSAFDFFVPESRDELLARIESARVTGRPFDLEASLRTADDTLLWVRVVGQTQIEGDHCTKVFGSIQDITARRDLERQLLHAQKIEGIGRLAGGVAHDFNNLLTVIFANVEALRDAVDNESPLRASAESIQTAATRAQNLTSQLLAFARKQAIEPRVIRPNDVVMELHQLLRRTLGANIELISMPDPQAGNLRMDPGQLQQVLLNLAVNARDAMPSGGRLTIQTRNVRLENTGTEWSPDVAPGDYVCLSVLDTGVGMTPAAVSHVFEPFYTTKKIGGGTGLGLSTCIGIVQQNKGDIRVNSDLGRGTTFELYFPRVFEEPTEPLAVTGTQGSPRGSECILLVEDEPAVRQVAGDHLKSLGYTVLEAEDGRAALTIARDKLDSIDLLLSDVVLPHLSGKQLAEQVLMLRPSMPVVFMSGYNDVEPDDLHAISRGFVAKPYTQTELAVAIRDVLDASKRA